MSKIQEVRDFLNELSSNPPKLPYDPTLLNSLFSSLSDKSRMSMAGLAALVERSQSLTARVLTVANSAMYGLQSHVTSVTRAIQVLGLVELRAMVILFSVSGAIPNSHLPKKFPAKDLWEHQVRTAMLGRQIAFIIEDSLPSGQNVPDADSIYTAALLHDLGKVILAARRPNDWAAISQLASEQKLGFAAAEEAYWGMDHGTAGAVMLKAWGLPDLLTQMISWHHSPELAPEYKQEVRLLAAANHLADHHQSLLHGEEGQRLPGEVKELLPDFAPALEAKAESLREVVLDSKAGAMASFAA